MRGWLEAPDWVGAGSRASASYTRVRRHVRARPAAGPRSGTAGRGDTAVVESSGADVDLHRRYLGVGVRDGVTREPHGSCHRLGREGRTRRGSMVTMSAKQVKPLRTGATLGASPGSLNVKTGIAQRVLEVHVHLASPFALAHCHRTTFPAAPVGVGVDVANDHIGDR
jgi:hypothetical protein